MQNSWQTIKTRANLVRYGGTFKMSIRTRSINFLALFGLAHLAGCSTPHANYHPSETAKEPKSALCHANLNTDLGNINKTYIDGVRIVHPFGWTSRSGIIYLRPGDHMIRIELSGGHKLHVPNKQDLFIYKAADGKLLCSNKPPPGFKETNSHKYVIRRGIHKIRFESGLMSHQIEANNFGGWFSYCYPEHSYFWNMYEGSFSCKAGEKFDLLKRATLRWVR